jgi:hypothetical protein
MKRAVIAALAGANGVIRVHVSFRAGGETHALRVDVTRNPKDEDDWPGTYEISAASGGNEKAIKRGKVQCFVE